MQLENINYWAIAPEIITSLTGVLLMLVDALQKKAERKLNALVALIGLVLALLSVFRLGDGGSYFGGMVVTDPIRVFFSVTILIVAMIATLLASQFVRDEGLPPGEFFTLLLFGTSGMLMLASAGDLVMVFLGLEIASITTYVMAGYRRYDARANESSLKYFLLGSFATAFLLYGMALVYGATGTTNIAKISSVINSGQIDYTANALLLVGAAMMLVGFGFKIASAPFHLWTPDVYEGAPTIVTGFMSTGPKAAVFAAFLRVFASGFASGAPGIATDLHTTWMTALAVIAAITMTIGNVIAISQKNIKRMLAYSSIAHAGYALVGFVTGEYASVAVAFYMLVYCVMSMGAFAVIQLLARAGDRKTEIADYAGIGFEAPGLTFSLSIFLFSLAGIPPQAGFMSKFFVFKTAWDAPYNLRWLVVVAVVNSIISIYYYLYPIVVMFFRPLTAGFVRPKVSLAAAIALIVTLFGTFYLGILPNRLINKMGSGSGAAQSAQTQVMSR